MGERREKLQKREQELEKAIEFTNQSKKKIIEAIQKLVAELNSGRISRREYEEKLNQLLKNRTAEQWLKYYDDYINYYEQHLKLCEKAIKKEKAKSRRKKIILILVVILVLISLTTIGILSYKFKSEILSKISGIAEKISIEKFFAKEKAPEIEAFEVLVSLDNKEAVLSEESLTQYQAVLGKSVRWKKQFTIDKPTGFEITLPKSSENIEIKKIEGGKKQNISFNINKKFFSKKVEVIVEEKAMQYEIIYETATPFVEEQDFGLRKRITISSEVYYKNILSFTEIPEFIKKGEEKIKLYKITEKDGKEIREKIKFTAYDTNENNLLDFVEWITPESDGVFELIIEISKAEHLDSEKNFISDIYNEVKALDNIWSEPINSGEYIRVTFSKKLDNTRDITIYPRVLSGTPKIEVYEIEGEEIITEFTNIKNNQYNKVLLTNIIGQQDVFDLKIVDGSVEIEHIIDPAITEKYYFIGGSSSGDGDIKELSTTQGTANATWTTTTNKAVVWFITQFNQETNITAQSFPVTFWCNKTSTAKGERIQVDQVDIYDCGTNSACSTTDYAFCTTSILNLECGYINPTKVVSTACSSSENRILNAGDYFGLKLVIDLNKVGINLFFNSSTYPSHINITKWTPEQDTTPPNINITSPLNQSYVTSNMNFNISANEDLGFCKFTLNNWLTNYTMTLNASLTGANYTNSSIGSGSYTAKFWCNDTSGNINNTEQIIFTIVNYGKLNVSLSLPTDNQQVNQNNSFTINATITCDGTSGAVCGNVYAYARYNSTATPGTFISQTSGATPFYIVFPVAKIENYSYDNWNFSTDPPSIEPRDIYFNGTYFWILDRTDDLVYRYNASGNYSADSWNFNVSAQEPGPRGITFNGTYFWIVGDNSSCIYRYFANGTYDNSWTCINVSKEASSPTGLVFNGTHFWVIGGNKEVHRYLANGTYDNWNFSVAPEEDPHDVDFDGTYFWVVGKGGTTVYRYNASGSYDNFSFNVSEQLLRTKGFYFNKTYFWIVGDDNDGGSRAFRYSEVITTSNPQTSPETLEQGESWNVSWIINATGLGFYEIDVFFNSSYGNINVPDNDTADATIEITAEKKPKISLELITPSDTSITQNVFQNQFFNITLNVSCYDADCGEINVTLDPIPGYCEVYGCDPTPVTGNCGDTFDTWISRVKFNTINNTSGWDITDGYENFTNVSTSVMGGDSYDLNVTIRGLSFYNYGGVFIDFNQNGILNDTGENFSIGDCGSDGCNLSTTIAIPNDAVIGPTRIRIIEADDENITNPCGFLEGNYYDYGEVEDYTIIIGGEEKGIISTTVGATPFYTNESNPRNITLNVNQSKLIVFWVNATGSIDSTYKFFAYANLTSDLKISNITDKWNVTITTEENQAPQIDYISPIPPTIIPTIASFAPVNFNITIYDVNNNLNQTSVKANFSRAGEDLRENSCLKIPGQETLNSYNFSCTIDMWYWDGAGYWNITIYAEDLSGAFIINDSITFQYNQLQSIEISPSEVLWPELVQGAINQTPNTTIIINNTGNYEELIQINAINLYGETNNTEFIDIGNFTVDIDSGTDACDGFSLQNGTNVNITGSYLGKGNLSLGEGIAQEEIFYCIKEVPSVSSQTYSTQQAGSWTITLLFAAIILKRKRKNKKRVAENDKLMQALNLIADELKQEYSLNKKEIIEIIIEKLRAKYKINKKEIKKLIKIEENIPIKIFSKELGGLEAITKYLKENLNLSYREIAELLNRNERTIWTAYKKAVEKQPEPIKIKEAEIKETEMFLPLSIFKNKKLTILESIILFLKSRQMKYSKIAEMLNRDQRNIWTIYSRAVKK